MPTGRDEIIHRRDAETQSFKTSQNENAEGAEFACCGCFSARRQSGRADDWMPDSSVPTETHE